jgi:hypothetical protein
MGEVYRARDTRIGREVALKVLPASYSADPDRLRRFEQEARAAGALNHPNVLTLHDVGRHDGTPYIVSELLDGETLRAKLSRGPLSVAKALDYAVQIARGLAAAHDRGIVHRDLKPENVFVTRDERVKILDFGIAKLIEPERPEQGIDEVATATRGTEAGEVVGTAGYMSPEQVRGRPADHRSDFFSFGAILHEMLTGRRTFQGESGVETMNAVLKGEPSPIVEANPQVPLLLERIVRRCLEKSPESRFQSARDLAFALEATEGSRRPPVLKAKRGIVWALVALAAATAVIPIVILRRRDPEERRPLRASILPPENTSFVTGGQVHPALSPDGRRIAFLARNREGKIWLWVRALSERAPQPVAETDMFGLPFWAPDGRQLGFCAGGKLKKVDLATGAVQELCASACRSEGAWAGRGRGRHGPRSREAHRSGSGAHRPRCAECRGCSRRRAPRCAAWTRLSLDGGQPLDRRPRSRYKIGLRESGCGRSPVLVANTYSDRMPSANRAERCSASSATACSGSPVRRSSSRTRPVCSALGGIVSTPLSTSIQLHLSPRTSSRRRAVRKSRRSARP